MCFCWFLALFGGVQAINEWRERHKNQKWDFFLFGFTTSPLQTSIHACEPTKKKFQFIETGPRKQRT